MSLAFDPVTARPDPALLAAVGECLTQVLASNRRLAQSPTINFHVRRRIEAVIAGLIDALDQLDGEADREQTAIETHGGGFRFDRFPDDAEDGCDREAMADDNGLADQDGGLEQGHMSTGLGAFG